MIGFKKYVQNCFYLLLVLLLVTCKKDSLETQKNTPLPVSENYSSMQDFYSKNGVALQTFTFNSVTGGNFTSPDGTHVTVPPNAFTTLSGGAISGTVTIDFKDIYKKSDMLLTDMNTIRIPYSTWLKSAGMFYIKAQISNVTVKLASGSVISVEQPYAATSAPVDTQMQPYLGVKDTTGKFGWYLTTDSLKFSVSNYLYSLKKFVTPEDSGTWCNSDDRYFFYNYYPPADTLSIIPSDNVDTFLTDVFLVYNTVNCIVHTNYSKATNKFSYFYAPPGLPFTVIAAGIRGGNLYSSFSQFTITGNQTVHVTLSQTATADFKNQLKALD